MSKASSELSGCVAAALPQTSSIKRSIRRVRQEEQCGSTVNHRNELILSEEDTRTNKGESFLLFDSGKVEDRMLISSSSLWLSSNYLEILISTEKRTIPD